MNQWGFPEAINNKDKPRTIERVQVTGRIKKSLDNINELTQAMNDLFNSVEHNSIEELNEVADRFETIEESFFKQS